MPSIHDLTNDDRARISRRIDNFFEFARDIIHDPSILKRIPSGAKVEAIPKDERESGRRYDIETLRMVATVKPRQRRVRIRHRKRGTARKQTVAATSSRAPRVSEERH